MAHVGGALPNGRRSRFAFGAAMGVPENVTYV